MNKLLTYLFVSLGVLAFMGMGVASAHGGFGGFGRFANLSAEDMVSRFEAMIQEKAEMIGITIEEYKGKWAEGKNFQEIAEESGITQEQLQERMREERQNRLRENLNALVEEGVITQEQADQRSNAMQERLENGGFGKGMNKCPCMGGRGGIF